MNKDIILPSYVPSKLNEFLNGIPHLTFYVEVLDNPSNFLENDKTLYYQSMLMFGFGPLVLLFLTMLILFIYYCSINMKKIGGNKNESSACYCSICVLVVFITLIFGAAGVVFYANFQCHEGIENAQNATLKLAQTQWYESMIISTYKPTSASLLKKNISSNEITDFLTTQVDNLETVEFYRFYGSFALIGTLAVSCLFILFSVCCKSSCLMIGANSFLLICLVSIYVYAGFVLATSIGIADICMDPYQFLYNRFIEFYNFPTTLAAYFIYCPLPSNNTYNLTDLQTSTQLTIDQLGSLLAIKNISNNICTSTSEQIEDLVESVCMLTEEGLALTGCALFALALMISIVACATPLTWRRFTVIAEMDDSEMDSDEVFIRSPSVNVTSMRPNLRTNNPMCLTNDDRIDSDTDENRVDFNRRSSIEFSPGTATFLCAPEEEVNLLGSDKPPPVSRSSSFRSTS